VISGSHFLWVLAFGWMTLASTPWLTDREFDFGEVFE